MKNRKMVSFSFDMDNLSVLGDFYNIKIYGDEPYLYRIYETAGKRLMDFMSEFDIKATFFIVGNELEKKEAVDYFLQLKDLKHELANHTYAHIEMYRLTPKEQRKQVVDCHEVILKKLNYTAKGFRAGGMQITPSVIKNLIEFGYGYDSSIFPSFWNFFLWAMAFMKKPCLRNLPRWRYFISGFQPKCPFLDCIDDGFVHIPVSVVPFFQIPFYATVHLLYPEFFKYTMGLVSKYREYLIYQCHMLDFVDSAKDKIPFPISRYPTYCIPLERRLKTYRQIFKTILEEYEPVTLHELSRQVRKRE